MKNILDSGRKKLEIFLEELYLKLEELFEELDESDDSENSDEEEIIERNEIKNKKTITENQEILFKNVKFAKSILIELKGNVDFENFIQEIWADDELKQISNVDKLSFHTLMSYMEELEFSLKKYQETNQIFQEMFEKENSSYKSKHISISQIFFSINQQELDDIIYGMVINERNFKKKCFVEEIMIRFDFILLEGRHYVDRYSVRNQNYFVPLLFPNNKPQQFLLEDKNGNQIEYFQLKLKREWSMEYYLPFKHSSFWKILFVKLRKVCSENQFSMSVNSEVYWKDGKH